MVRGVLGRKRFNAEQIIVKLCEVEIIESKNLTQVEVEKKLVICDQKLIHWRKEYGELLVDQSKRFKELEAAKLNANNPNIHNNIGVIYEELHQFDQAIKEFFKAIDINPEHTKPYNNTGVVYYSIIDFQGALRNYQNASSTDPENLEALNNFAVTYKRTDQLERAKTVLNQTLAINPAHTGTHYNLAVAYEGEGNIKSAIHFYQNFVEVAFVSHPTLSV